MAKGKSSNPVDAYRKAQRAKELKKNKETRTKVREVVTLKKDIGPLEAELRKLTAADQAKSLDKNGQARLVELRAEVDRIKKTKEEYVAAHPEHRKFVYAHEEAREQARKAAGAAESSNAAGAGGLPVFDKNGRLRDPTRSVYYDPVLNPYGVPPPGMPYMEKPSERQDDDDDAMSSEDEDSDDDIAMPEGPPPDTVETQEDSDSDDSIVMPEGTPPPEARIYAPTPVNQPVMMMPALPPIGMPFDPGFPQHMPPMYAPPGAGNFAPPMSYAQGQYQARPYAQGNAFMPPPPPPPRGFFPGQAGPGPVRPPRDSGWSFRPPPSTANLPVRPGGIMNDPLSGVPHQTFQAHRQARREEAQDVALAAAATTTIEGKSTTTGVPPPASAEISAAPQLRDLRKEAAVFVPRAMKKKKPAGNAQVITAAPVVSSAPENGGVNESQDASGMPGVGNQHAAPNSAPTYNPAAAGGGLLSKLSGVLGTPATAPAKKEKEDDYKAFLAGLDSLEQ